MAIQIFCTKCKSSYGLDAKSCSKCGTTFGRDKKYRVCVSVKGKRVTRVVDNLTSPGKRKRPLKADMVRGEWKLTKIRKGPHLRRGMGQISSLGQGA